MKFLLMLKLQKLKFVGEKGMSAKILLQLCMIITSWFNLSIWFGKKLTSLRNVCALFFAPKCTRYSQTQCASLANIIHGTKCKQNSRLKKTSLSIGTIKKNLLFFSLQVRRRRGKWRHAFGFARIHFKVSKVGNLWSLLCLRVLTSYKQVCMRFLFNSKKSSTKTRKCFLSDLILSY